MAIKARCAAHCDSSALEISRWPASDGRKQQRGGCPSLWSSAQPRAGDRQGQGAFFGSTGSGFAARIDPVSWLNRKLAHGGGRNLPQRRYQRMSHSRLQLGSSSLDRADPQPPRAHTFLRWDGQGHEQSLEVRLNDIKAHHRFVFSRITRRFLFAWCPFVPRPPDRPLLAPMSCRNARSICRPRVAGLGRKFHAHGPRQIQADSFTGTCE